MQVILLERVEKLGQMGDEVRVKDGFARNYLLPKKKALRATDANREYFKTQKTQLETRNLSQKKEAESVSGKLSGKTFMMLRQAGDRGQLYGSGERVVTTGLRLGDVLAEAGEEEAEAAPAAEALFEEGAGPKPTEETEES